MAGTSSTGILTPRTRSRPTRNNIKSEKLKISLGPVDVTRKCNMKVMYTAAPFVISHTMLTDKVTLSDHPSYNPYPAIEVVFQVTQLPLNTGDNFTRLTTQPKVSDQVVQIGFSLTDWAHTAIVQLLYNNLCIYANTTEEYTITCKQINISIMN